MIFLLKHSRINEETVTSSSPIAEYMHPSAAYVSNTNGEYLHSSSFTPLVLINGGRVS